MVVDGSGSSHHKSYSNIASHFWMFSVQWRIVKKLCDECPRFELASTSEETQTCYFP